eukprot:TRINITY_DN4642_c1_g3_i1.p1 TRINITY_DN4642_c1_g3~~TRINITY_DN4642_c1_g3_i1.p1  ORF type:complete len:642 (+),score=170.08 TRINITY_DN4642_c1_g3_i1:57-1928(+)
MAESAALGRGGGASRGGGRGGAASRRVDVAALGLPTFCRPRHAIRGTNMFAVPIWDITSRWMPEGLASATVAPATASNSCGDGGAVARVGEGAIGTASQGAATVGGVNVVSVEQQADAGGGDDAPCGDDDTGSESDHSEIAWEGRLGDENRVWSRAENDSALLLIRRLQAVAPRERRGVTTAGGYVADGVETAETEEVGQASVPSAASASTVAATSAPTPLPKYCLGISAALVAQEQLIAGTDQQLDRRLAEILKVREPRWAVCALRSGHFAGAIFNGPEPVIHKAIHRYTVRAKAGGAQSASDNTRGKAKSAGSTLRRYGEQRLAEEIKELMVDKWAESLAACELVFVSVSRRMRSTLLGTEKEPFVPNNKVRRLPFMVGKPTFEAVQAAHLKVASVLFADDATAEALTAKFRPTSASAPAEDGSSKANQKAKKQAAAVEEAPLPKYCEEQDELYTQLHAAAADGDDYRITELLDDGLDPAALDGRGRVPYYLCTNQRCRDAFRRWRGSNEEVWDWAAARVPEALTDERDQQKKEKEKEKKKRQKEKAKANKAKAKDEEEERRSREEEEAEALKAAQAKCDNCQKPLLAKPFARLDFLYCSSECVNAHRRHLQAEAAMKRFG